MIANTTGMQYGDAINNAIERTKYLLWERRSGARWRNYSILSYLCGYVGGGGGGGGGDLAELFKGSGDKHDTSLRLMMGCSLAGAMAAGEPYLWLIVLFVLGLFFLAVAHLFLSNFARVVLVENIVHDRHALLEPFSRLSRLGWSVLWWGFAFFCGWFVVMGLLVGAPAGAIALAADDNPGVLLMFIPLLMWAAVVFIPLSFINGYFQEIVVPLMYRQNCTAGEAWAIFKPMFNAQKGKWIGYMVIHFFLVVAGGIATGVMGLMVLLLVALVVGLPAFAIYAAAGTTAGVIAGVVAFLIFLFVSICVTALFSAPVTVVARSFSMYILQQVAPEYGFLPLGGRPVSPTQITHFVESPAAGAGLNPEQPPAAAEWSETPSSPFPPQE